MWRDMPEDFWDFVCVCGVCVCVQYIINILFCTLCIIHYTRYKIYNDIYYSILYYSLAKNYIPKYGTKFWLKHTYKRTHALYINYARACIESEVFLNMRELHRTEQKRYVHYHPVECKMLINTACIRIVLFSYSVVFKYWNILSIHTLRLCLIIIILKYYNIKNLLCVWQCLFIRLWYDK